MRQWHPPADWGWRVGEGEPIRGIVVGGCVAMYEWGDMLAHAHGRHVGSDPAWHGWICMRYDDEQWLVRPDGRPAGVLIHEAAHLISNEDHTTVWEQAVRDLGGDPHPIWLQISPNQRYQRYRSL